jgi:hypothetical protein
MRFNMVKWILGWLGVFSSLYIGVVWFRALNLCWVHQF